MGHDFEYSEHRMPKSKTKNMLKARARRIGPRDARLKKNEDRSAKKKAEREAAKKGIVRRVKQVNSAMFFSFNTQLIPPYQVILDTNFINFSISNKLDPIRAAMDCLYAKVELEKLGRKYRLALRLAKDKRFKRLSCDHKGT